MNKELITQLREQTGAGMTDCVKALTETNGDLTLAAEVLRKKGIAKMAKRSERTTKEGVVKIAEVGGAVYLVELDAETDFVVRSAKFQAFATAVLNVLTEKNLNTLESLLAAPLQGSTVKEELAALSGTFGEKLEIKKCAKVSAGANGAVYGYAHTSGKIGAAVALESDKNIDALKELAKELAMQVAALNPTYLKPEDVPADILAKEKEIYSAELKGQGKPENIWPKIIEGKLQKFYADNCLLKQPTIRDEAITVEQLIKQMADQAGAKVAVKEFVRFQV
jgi:elongation factor Ts